MCKEHISLAKRKLENYVGKKVRLRIGEHGTLNTVHVASVDNQKVNVIYSNAEAAIPATYDLSLVKEISSVID